MKKTINLLLSFCFVCLYTQGQNFKIMHKGNELSHGDVIEVNEVTTSDFGELILDAKLSFLNSSTESKTYTAELTILSLTTGGDYQFCFGSCLRPSSITTVKMTHTLDKGTLVNQLLEYFPKENSYGKSEAKFKVYENGDEANAIEVSVLFNYSNDTGVNKLVAQPKLAFNSIGACLKLDYMFDTAAERFISYYQITGTLGEKQMVNHIEGSIQYIMNPGCYIFAVEESGCIIYTYKVIVR